ncbi:hypothetical protein [Nonomuraea sp. NPDC005650]|uniref:hypothetical protein n=1 Tax=Nonomuraea sp. NPDC005650 TaxID=3157045 RepID=UPI0033A3414F
MDRRKAGLAAGIVMALVMALTLGGSGALAASPRQDPTGDPCAKAATCTPTKDPCAKAPTCTPADIAKAKAAKAAEAAEPGRGEAKCSPGMKQPEQPKPVESGMLAKALAASLGVGLDQATAAAAQLDLLSQKGGINPKSPEFAAIAERLGVPAERLIQALDDFKRSLVTEKTPGS